MPTKKELEREHRRLIRKASRQDAAVHILTATTLVALAGLIYLALKYVI